MIQKFRDWSQGIHVPTDSEFSFLAAWTHLSQIAFAGGGSELITLGADSFRQIGSWDAAHGKLDHVIPLPLSLAPLLMSDQGTFIGCVQEGPERRIVLLNRITGEMISWPEVNLPLRSRISDDERQYATFGRGPQIAVYDLEMPGDQPTHLMTLDANVNAVEFPHHQKVWNILTSEPNGRIRLLSEQGKDLIPPIQLRRATHRLKAVCESTRVLACGPGLLATVDVETGSVATLVDERPAQREGFNYTALAVSRDGKIAAAARAVSQPRKVERPYEIEIWDMRLNRKLNTLAGHEAAIHTMSFSADGQRLASGDILGFVQIWNLKTIQD